MSEAKVLTLATYTRRMAAGRLRRARVARGWSQERAAQELGIGVRTLRDLELGRARMTALEALCAYETLGEQQAPVAQMVERLAPKGDQRVAGSNPVGGLPQETLLRSRAAVAREPHKLQVAGSTPACATPQKEGLAAERVSAQHPDDLAAHTVGSSGAGPRRRAA